MEELKKTIEEFFDAMTLQTTISVSEEMSGIFRVSIETPDARFLIGSQGETIESLETVLKRILQKKSEVPPRFYLDVNDYRQKRYETLKEGAKQYAKQARLYRKEIVMDPMPSFERRIVHTVLSEYPDIITESIGEGRDRRIVIKPHQ